MYDIYDLYILTLIIVWRPFFKTITSDVFYLQDQINLSARASYPMITTKFATITLIVILGTTLWMIRSFQVPNNRYILTDKIKRTLAKKICECFIVLKNKI
jgi:hypothetical protein